MAWRKLAEVVAQNITKGRLVAVEGRLQIRSYDDQNGIRRKAAEVIANEVKFLDRPKQEQTSEPEEPGWGEPEFDEVPFKVVRHDRDYPDRRTRTACAGAVA